MPKLIESWQCETCSATYNTIQRARNCESIRPAIYPIGCIFGDHSNPPWPKGSLTFAVAFNHIRGHYNRGGIWECSPQSLGSVVVNMRVKKPGHGLSLGPKDGDVWPSMPTFQLMTDWLETQGITPTIWNGHASISLREFLVKE